MAIRADRLASHSAALALHSVDFREPDFQPSGESLDFYPEVPAHVAGTMSFALFGDRLQVVYRYHMACVGAPSRVSIDKNAFTLRSGEWGRVVYNGRFSGSDSGHWYYRKNVINVAWNVPVEENAFTAVPPTARFEDLAMLF